MSDLELLELAAKACGYDTSHKWNAYRLTLTPPVIALCIPEVSTGWNPLDDGGDALKLSVATGLLVDASDIGVSINVQYIIDGIARPINEEVLDDPYAATRRAIVRAAAEIGKAMK